MARLTTVVRKSRKAIKDLELLKVLQSEIKHEESSIRFQGNQDSSFGDFVVDWDSSRSEDVVLKKKCESGEEVAISALLGPEVFEGNPSFPRMALMKVCIKKPGLSSILQFDCCISGKAKNGHELDIRNASYIASPACLNSASYMGPSFSSLDHQLQDELNRYMLSRGIEGSFGNSLLLRLLLRLHQKEQDQYVNWLRKLHETIEQSEG